MRARRLLTACGVWLLVTLLWGQPLLAAALYPVAQTGADVAIPQTSVKPVFAVEELGTIANLEVIDWTTRIASDDARHWAVVMAEEKESCVLLDGVEGPRVDEVDMLTFSPDGRHFAYRARSGSDESVVFDGMSGPAFDTIEALVFSLDSAHFAYVALGSRGQRIVLDGEVGPYLKTMGMFAESLVFSPNGEHLAYIGYDEYGLFPVIDGERGPRYEDMGNDGIVFSPDSQHMAYVVWHTSSSHQSSLGLRQGVLPTRVPLADTDARAYVVWDGVEILVGDLAGGLTFSPDSQHLAVLAQDGEKWTLALDGRAQGYYDDALALPVFSADSQHVAFVASENDMEVVVVDGVPGWMHDVVDRSSVKFTRDNQIAYNATKGNDWVVVIGGEEVAQYDDVYGPYFSPDGQHMVYLAEEGRSWFAVRDGVPGPRYDEIYVQSVMFDQTSEHLFYLGVLDEVMYAVVDGMPGKGFAETFGCSCDRQPTVAEVGSFSYLAVRSDSLLPFIPPTQLWIDRVTVSFPSQETSAEPVIPPTQAPVPVDPAPGEPAPGEPAPVEPAEFPFQAVVIHAAKLYVGPGANFPAIGALPLDMVVTVVGANATGEWYQLESGRWIEAVNVARVTEPPPLVAPTEPAQSPTGEAIAPEGGEFPFAGVVTRNANQRSGPGTNFDTVRSVLANTVVTVVGTNPAGDWYELDTGAWMAAFLVERLRAGTAEEALAEAQVHLNACAEKWMACDFTGALVECNRALALYPGDVEMYNERALVRAGTGDYRGALADLAQAELLVGELPDNLLDTRAYIHLKMGAYTLAYDDYWELWHDREYFNVYTDLGMAITVVRISGMGNPEWVEAALDLLEIDLAELDERVDDVSELDPELADLVTWAREILQEAGR